MVFDCHINIAVVMMTTALLLASSVSMVFAGDLDPEDLSELRIEGMCAKLTHVDTEEVIQNYNHIFKVQRGVQAFSQAFQEMLDDILGDSYDGLSQTITKFCEGQDYDKYDSISLEDCMKIEEILRECKILEGIIGKCYDFAEDQETTPSFESMDQRNQDWEKCLMDFDEDEITHQSTDPIDKIADSLEKYGVVIIKNFFDPAKMSLKGSVRGEIVLPFKEPFRSIMEEIDHSILVDVMQTYGQQSDTDVLNMEYPTSIFSIKGSPEQPLHRDYVFPKTLFKIAVSTHDTPKVQGPTGFCPCTHTNGDFFPIWETDIECPLRFQPSFLPAGTVVLYDQALEHQGMDNQYDTRFILDISYTFGDYKSEYIESGNWSDEAKSHVDLYRANRRRQRHSFEEASSETKEAL
ncbi:MAG: hypothetical protein SGARI_002202 [Bacillariaceae sp.]